MILNRPSLTLCALVLLTLAPLSSAADLKTTASLNAVISERGANDSSPEKEKDIRRLLELSGARKLSEQAFQQMIMTFKEINPSVPNDYWNSLNNAADIDDLVEKIIPAYDRHLTHQEIRDIVKFYETPSGEKLAKVQPQIMGESMEIGKEWGKEMAEKIMRELKEKPDASSKPGNTRTKP